MGREENYLFNLIHSKVLDVAAASAHEEHLATRKGLQNPSDAVLAVFGVSVSRKSHFEIMCSALVW